MAAQPLCLYPSVQDMHVSRAGQLQLPHASLLLTTRGNSKAVEGPDPLMELGFRGQPTSSGSSVSPQPEL